ncbi:unnamed protein product, partial [Pocillopora meandrina]
MAIKKIFIFMALAFAVDAFKWKHCEDNLPLRVDSLSLSPHPLRLRKGQRVTLGGKFRVGENAGTNYKVDALVWKKLPIIGWAKVPCFGMCTHSIRCEKLVDFLKGAKCPLAPGSYEVKQQTHSMPDIPIPSFLKNV